MAAAGDDSSDSTSSDCDGDEQEEPSLASPTAVIQKPFDKLTAQKSEEDDDLSIFRQQWHRELVDSSPEQDNYQLHQGAKQGQLDALDDEEKAKQLFLHGIELEKRGKLYEAVQNYKKAVQIMPDIETKLYLSQDTKPHTPEVPEQQVTVTNELEYSDGGDDDDDDDNDDDVELVARLQSILARKGRLFEPQYQQRGAHISWLPYELVLLVLRWVVSADLDSLSLERAASTSRGFYVAARDHDIWRTLCIRTWGLNCATPKALGYQSWRDMYIQRPRLRLDGCYISKTSYLRHGENSFQDQFYKPWYLIDYYRYLRFFPEGVVLMWTTTEEPATCVKYLRDRGTKSHGILSGHYRLVGDKVVILVKKPLTEKKQAQPSNSRFRARRRDIIMEQHEQSFQLELEVKTLRSRHNWQLVWSGYSVSTRPGQWSNFELQRAKFPPFYFSRVRHYTAEAEAPLT